MFSTVLALNVNTLIHVCKAILGTWYAFITTEQIMTTEVFSSKHASYCFHLNPSVINPILMRYLSMRFISVGFFFQVGVNFCGFISVWFINMGYFACGCISVGVYFRGSFPVVFISIRVTLFFVGVYFQVKLASGAINLVGTIDCKICAEELLIVVSQYVLRCYQNKEKFN